MSGYWLTGMLTGAVIKLAGTVIQSMRQTLKPLSVAI